MPPVMGTLESAATRPWDGWDIGLLLLGPDERVNFANARARCVLAASTDEELETRWSSVKEQLDPTLQEGRTRHLASLEARATTGRSSDPDLSIQVHLLGEDVGVAYLVLLQDTAGAVAIEKYLRYLAYHRSLASLSRDTSDSLKDMLNVISMNVELLSRAADGGEDRVPDPARTRYLTRHADVVRRELRRLDRSLDVLLARDIEERDSPQSFDVKAICEALLQLIAARASRQRVVVSSTLPEGPARMRGFPDRVHGALLGLLVNALDAMPEGGTLDICLAKGTTIRIRVCDSGPGMEADRLPDIWRLQFATKASGIGLGLYVTRSIIENHGGTVHYQPNRRGGSCFVIELPSGMST